MRVIRVLVLTIRIPGSGTAHSRANWPAGAIPPGAGADQ